ncbi:MAG: methyl-accepting chemotaxis protein [Tardiphaga sp.]
MSIINKIRIRTKLLLVLALTAASLAAAIWAATSILHERMLQDRIAKVKATTEMAYEQASVFEGLAAAGKMTRDEAIARFKESGRGMWFDNHKSYVTVASIEGLHMLNPAVPKIEGTRGNKMADGRYVLDAQLEAVKNSDEGLTFYDYPKPGETVATSKMVYVKKFSPWGVVITTGLWIDDLEADYHTALYKLAGIGVLVLLLTGSLIMLISYNITRSLAGLRDKMERLVAGDLSVDISEAGRADEIGEMAKAVQVFKSNAVAMQDMQAEQKDIEARADQHKKQAMRDMADGFEARIGSIVGIVSGAAAAMQSTARTMSGNAESTQRQTSAVAAGAEESTVNVQTVAAASEELATSITEIGRQVTQASVVARKANEESEKTNISVSSLADAAQKIGEVVAFITQIASQTNLLALNATIEAARAGEAGRGFAVVASEVKSLATQTSKATDDIRAQIEAIQAETADAVAAIKRISMTIVEVNEISTTIASAMEEQGAATQEITRNVQEAAASAKNVSQNINGVSEAVEATGHAASELLGEADKLAQQAKTLQAEVGDFLATVRAA